MHTMNSIYSVVKPLFEVTLIAVLIGTRLFCDLGTAMHTSQYCAHADFLTHSESDITGTDCHEGHGRGCSEAPSETPKDSKPDQCCTNWSIFMAKPTKILAGSDLERPLVGARVFIATLHPYEPLSARNELAYMIGNNRAPNYPLYLVTHSIRV